MHQQRQEEDEMRDYGEDEDEAELDDEELKMYEDYIAK